MIKNMIFGLCMLVTLNINAQEVTLTIEVSSQEVRVGEPFDLSITLKNGQGDINPPDLTDFEILGGPNFSSTFSMVNGETNMSSSYSYKLRAIEEGQFDIPSATAEVDGVELKTDPLPIRVNFDPNYAPTGPAFKEKTIRKKRKGIRL